MTTKKPRNRVRYFLQYKPRKGGQRWASILEGLKSLEVGEKLRVYYPKDTAVQRFQVNLINQIARKIDQRKFRTWRVSASILVERTQ